MSEALPIWKFVARCWNWQDVDSIRILGEHQIFHEGIGAGLEVTVRQPRPAAPTGVPLSVRAVREDETESEVRDRVQAALKVAGVDCRELRVSNPPTPASRRR
jgi:hypothetical protein